MITWIIEQIQDWFHCIKLKRHRLEILEETKYICFEYSGLCSAIHGAMLDVCGVDCINIVDVFPLFTIQNAMQFDALNRSSNTSVGRYYFWWPRDDWSPDGGRMQFLDWLIEQYKEN